MKETPVNNRISLSKTRSSLQRGRVTGHSPFFQPKLTINQPNDVYEQEADAVAESVMRMADKDIVQTKFFKPTISTIQRKCTHCDEEEKKKMQRKEMNADTVNPNKGFESYVSSLDSSGQSLSGEARSFYEPRFGYDFSNVKVHADGAAARSAQSINALAYTSGNNIVFNNGQYSPGTDGGKKLLAHELAHVVQQKGPVQTKGIQRAVSPQFAAIKEKLSRNIIDWVVTDTEAHGVLVLLKQLNQNDLRDTVAAMESNGLVDTFFSNVPDEDAAKESEFLQQVQNYRAHSSTSVNGQTSVTVSSTFSCTIEQGSALYQLMTKASAWIDSAIARLTEFLAAPAAPGMAATRDALQMHVHTLDSAHITILLNRLQTFKNQMYSASSLELECATPTDTFCRDIAAAYVQHTVPKKMRFCRSFFNASDETWRIGAMIHEAMHALLPKSGGGTVTDRGYAQERVYEFLTPEEAFDNSDSIAMLVRVLAQGKAVTGRQMSQPQDSISDCSKDQLLILRPAIARAARWNLNAINILADTKQDMIQDHAPLRRQHFGSDDAGKIPDIMKVYKESRDKFNSSLDVECETAGGACSSTAAGYYRSFIFKSGTLHVCPVFFTLSSEDSITSFLALAVMNSTGKPDADSTKYADFAKDLTNRYWGSPATI